MGGSSTRLDTTTKTTLDARASSDDLDSTADSAPICRICFEGSGPLISPCHCRGTQGLLHESCLLQWRRAQVVQGKSSAAMRCEICGSKYAGQLPLPARPLTADLVDFAQELIDTTTSLAVYSMSSPKLCWLMPVGLTCWHFGIHGLLALVAIFVGVVFMLHMNGMRLSVMGTSGQQRRLGITSFGPPVEGLAPGMLLVSINASGPFTKTVLYVIRHNDNGSLAVILNSVCDANQPRSTFGPLTLSRRSGGPVDSLHMPFVNCIHNRESVPGAQRILRNGPVFLSQSIQNKNEFISSMIEDSRPGNLVMINGVSSWRDRQLEGEVRRRAWGWIPPEHVQAQDVLEMDPMKLNNLWERLMYSPHLQVFEQ